VSNYDVDQMQAFGRFGRLETLQPPYHMFRSDIEETILRYTAEHDIGVLAYGPLAHGLLSGRMTESTTFAADDWRSASPDFTGETFRRNLVVVERLKGFARERDIGLPQLAVAWTLANPAVQVAIVGARRPAQLDGTASAADVELSAADLQEIDAILAETPACPDPFVSHELERSSNDGMAEGGAGRRNCRRGRALGRRPRAR
jgi:aryl-alcohol dehydrogenase-like predicted oxidoreductase